MLQVAYRGSCYTVHLTYSTFQQADKACTAEGAAMLTIDSEYEQVFKMCDMCQTASHIIYLRLQAKITTIISETGVHFWVGMRYNEDTQTFEWASGAAVSYTHWSEYEPDLTHHDSQDGSCPYMHRHEDIGYWKVNELKLFSF